MPSTKSFMLYVSSEHWKGLKRAYIEKKPYVVDPDKVHLIKHDGFTQGHLLLPPPRPMLLEGNQEINETVNVTSPFYRDPEILYPGEYEVFAKFDGMESNVIKLKLKEDTESISYLIRALELSKGPMRIAASAPWATERLRALTGQNYGFMDNFDRGKRREKKINLWKKWFSVHKDVLRWNKEKKMYEITPPIKDSDNDGADDRVDECPYTE
ncbi:MAG: hypothetical protein GY862_36975, partial [Gammaproteobacteria bacterium]|nr:hypothetical protein [Gammaproteobacteria bacterium]